jgi:hypothetical protein
MILTAHHCAGCLKQNRDQMIGMNTFERSSTSEDERDGILLVARQNIGPYTRLDETPAL